MQIRWFAGAAQAVGCDAEPAPAQPVGTVQEVLVALHPEAATVIGRCSLLADGRRLEPGDPWPVDAQLVDVLPPFAGG